MRITGGNLCGRRLHVPPGEAVRPTQDRVREAFFSSQASRVAGARFLDLFAGSGAVGLEALSRGAEQVLMVESVRRVFSVLKRNMDELGVDQGRCVAVCAEVERFLCRSSRDGGYDLIYADPPYRNISGGRQQRGLTLTERLLDAIAEYRWLKPGGVFVMETGEKEPLQLSDGWCCVMERRYGAAKLWFCEQKEDTGHDQSGDLRGNL